MRERKAFEKWIRPKLKKIQKVLLLEHFEPLNIKYGLESTRAYAECKVNYPYQSINLLYGDELLKDFRARKYDQILQALTHEMCHPITDPLYCKAVTQWISKSEIEDEREKLTDHIANIVLKNIL